MPDWDQNSSELRDNLIRLLRNIRDAAQQRFPLDSETVRQWHIDAMRGLDVPDRAWVGCFRGEVGAFDVGVRVGSVSGIAPGLIRSALKNFDIRLAELLDLLDSTIPVGADLNCDELEAVINACAWAHAEWVQIHPFANGNGRTARLLSNAIAMRYGLPPFVRLRPRPNDGYPEAGRRAMKGHWEPTAVCFRKMLLNAIR